MKLIRQKRTGSQKDKHKRKRRLTRLAERLTNALNLFGKDKFETIKCKVSFRKSKCVEITDETLIPDEFFKITKTPCKADIKTAINEGKEVNGAIITEKKKHSNKVGGVRNGSKITESRWEIGIKGITKGLPLIFFVSLFGSMLTYNITMGSINAISCLYDIAMIIFHATSGYVALGKKNIQRLIGVYNDRSEVLSKYINQAPGVKGF